MAPAATTKMVPSSRTGKLYLCMLMDAEELKSKSDCEVDVPAEDVSKERPCELPWLLMTCIMLVVATTPIILRMLVRTVPDDGMSFFHHGMQARPKMTHETKMIGMGEDVVPPLAEDDEAAALAMVADTPPAAFVVAADMAALTWMYSAMYPATVTDMMVSTRKTVFFKMFCVALTAALFLAEDKEDKLLIFAFFAFCICKMTNANI